MGSSSFSGLGGFFFTESEFSMCQFMCQVELSDMYSFSSLLQKFSCMLYSYICMDNNKKPQMKFLGGIEDLWKN